MKAHDFMAAGRPLIVTDVGDLGPFVRQWQIGHTAEAAAAPLAETVLTAVAQPDILRQQGEQARRVAEEQFAWPVVAAKLDSFYQKVRKL
jgi:glycosyltransferase involved in cell wall biosynthesis